MSNDDPMNDDAPELNSLSRECYQALSSPILKERAWGQGTGPWGQLYTAVHADILAPLCEQHNHKMVPAYKNYVDPILNIRSSKKF